MIRQCYQCYSRGYSRGRALGPQSVRPVRSVRSRGLACGSGASVGNVGSGGKGFGRRTLPGHHGNHGNHGDHDHHRHASSFSSLISPLSSCEFGNDGNEDSRPSHPSNPSHFRNYKHPIHSHNPQHAHYAQRRWFGISRHPDSAQSSDPNKATDDDDDLDDDDAGVVDPNKSTEDDAAAASETAPHPWKKGLDSILTADDLEYEYEGGIESVSGEELGDQLGIEWGDEEYDDYDGYDEGEGGGAGGVGDVANTFRDILDDDSLNSSPVAAYPQPTQPTDVGLNSLAPQKSSSSFYTGYEAEEELPVPSNARSWDDYHERQKIRKELDERTGRLFNDRDGAGGKSGRSVGSGRGGIGSGGDGSGGGDEWVITDEEWMSSDTYEDFVEWSPRFATRRSLERVKVFEGGVPTLRQLSTLPLPPTSPPAPGHYGYPQDPIPPRSVMSSSSSSNSGSDGGKVAPRALGAWGTSTPKPNNTYHTQAYAKHRKRGIKERIQRAVQRSVLGDLEEIVRGSMPRDALEDGGATGGSGGGGSNGSNGSNGTNGGMTWQQKQEAIDHLYETISARVREHEPILGKLPNFEELCEEGLEEVLTRVQRNLVRVAKLQRGQVGQTGQGGGSSSSDGSDDGSDDSSGDGSDGSSSDSSDSSDDEEDGSKDKESTMKMNTTNSQANGSNGSNASNSSITFPKVSNDNLNEILDVMGLNKEEAVPIFMDLLAVSKTVDASSKENDNGATDNVAIGANGTNGADDADDADGNENTTNANTNNANPNDTINLSKFLLSSNPEGVPNLIYPLTTHPNDGVGRMVEEWELAAHKETKRIMMREGMQEIARLVEGAVNGGNGNGNVRVFVNGRRGVGKTATLAGLVASARLSGHIVVYHPDGDRLRRHGYYVEPTNLPPESSGGSPLEKDLYDMPMIAQEFCTQLLAAHEDDLKNYIVGEEEMRRFLKEEYVKRVYRRVGEGEEEGSKGKGGKGGKGAKGAKEAKEAKESEPEKKPKLTLAQLLKVGSASTSLATGCYLTTITTLKHQTTQPFTVVMDEFNCYYDHGHFFHMDYDENVGKAIPVNKVTCLKPFLDMVGLYPEVAGTDVRATLEERRERGGSEPDMPDMMKRGAIVVATSESRAVHRKFTKSLTEAALLQSQSSQSSQSQSSQSSQSPEKVSPMHVIDIRRFTPLETQHILSNFEITGVGRLRFDKGNTVLNEEEMEYLRMVSGGVGQPLLDACMLP